MPNRLANETSPYLLQHAGNPVDWYPWGPEALETAKRDDKPILLSIGYAACHWCHVMAHESFENEQTARLMNDNFVNIKVDREERPDIDGIYMQAVQAMTGQGGWPMTMFLMPDGSPFYGGTYFPPDDRHGLPSFRTVLQSVTDAYARRREGVAESAEQLRQIYQSNLAQTRPGGGLTPEMLKPVYRSLAQRYDARNGGFGSAPKFPATMVLDFLLRHWKRTGTDEALEIVVNSFRKMARGGIYDQIGGGFARYSVDASWLVPHFEKMLYDNALLTRLGAHLWQATKDEEIRRVTIETVEWVGREMTAPEGGFYYQIGGGFARYSVDASWLVPHFEKMLYDNALLTRLGAHLWQATKDEEIRRVTVETVEWISREMTAPAGGFYSSLDADSEGHEGKFYVWSEAELDSLLGADSSAFKTYYGVTRGGNFEGKNILFVPSDRIAAALRAGIDEKGLDIILERARQALYDTRARRVWPGRDEKILASWNGLMLRGVATAAKAFGRDDFATLAIRNAEFLAREMVHDGRVMRSHKEGVTRISGFLDDHAAVALGFLAVYELTFDERWVTHAREIADAMIEWFWDDGIGAFFDTARDAEQLITRPRDVTDNATPSGTSLAIELLLYLAELQQDGEYRRRAIHALETLAEPMLRFPTAFGHLLGCADMELHGAIEVALVGETSHPGFRALERMVAERYVPSLVLAGGAPGSRSTVKLLENRPLVDDKPTAYVCRGYACDKPVTDPEALSDQLQNAAQAGINSNEETGWIG
ncbi:MAG TPA: thioredoxin domain-containing protein [Gemmatimonadaceae bacterium]